MTKEQIDRESALFDDPKDVELMAAVRSEFKDENDRVYQHDGVRPSEIGVKLHFRCMSRIAFVVAIASREMSLPMAKSWLVTGLNRERAAFLENPPPYPFDDSSAARGVPGTIARRSG